MELNDVFKANNYAGRKKVLDRFPLSKEDKDNVNKSIEKLSNSNGGVVMEHLLISLER